MFYLRFVTCFIIAIPAFQCHLPAMELVIPYDDLVDKARGMWLGQIIANTAGRPTEGRFAGPYPNPAESVPWVLKQVWDADDDTDIEYIAIHTLETNGFDFTAEDISTQWIEHITASGIYISNRQAWFLMKDSITPPFTGSRSFNIHWYSIDSQITTEVLGAICPAMPQQAIDLTARFAKASNEGFPVHAAQLYTAMYANAFLQDPTEPNVAEIVKEGLNSIPESSRTYDIAADVLRWYTEDAADGQLDWRVTRRKIYDHYQGSLSKERYYNWVESTVNTGATILSILYGEGDFKKTSLIGILAGWDCDCNPATAAGLIGIIKGYSRLPADLTDPAECGDSYKNIYRPYLPDENHYLPQYDTISNIAGRIAALAEQNIIKNGGYAVGTGPGRTLHIPINDSPLITEPEKPDPSGPQGLVRQAVDAGLDVTVSAAVEYHIANNDRRNLDAVIDGITDNSYNGHKPYYSFTSGNQKPSRDWYQLNFSQPVKFDGLTFYEGDIVWGGINTYCRVDSPQGGFFEDITVEVLKGGKYVAPANLVLQTPLDQYQMYQEIEFAFSPVVSDAIRIIGKAGGSLQYTTIMELQAKGTVEPGLYLKGIDINGGSVQRSKLTKIELEFSEDVNLLQDALGITEKTSGIEVEREQMEIRYNSSSYKAAVTFDTDLDGVFGDSLAEGEYQLKVLCSNVITGQGGTLLDDDITGPDGYYTSDFHRLYGDADGSGTVDNADFEILSSVWNGPPALTGLDFDSDGAVQFSDLIAFIDNWLIGN